MEPTFLIVDRVDLHIIAFTLLANGYVLWLGKSNDERCVLWYRKAEEDEIDDDPLDELDESDLDEEEHSGSCPTARNGAPCCLEKGHVGDHSYKCASPNCPGYPWPASENPHPGTTCSEKKA